MARALEACFQEDFRRPIRNYFYWQRHRYDMPICWSLRSIFGGRTRCLGLGMTIAGQSSD